MYTHRHAKQLMKYQAEVAEEISASSFSLPPDTPAFSQATSFTNQDSISSTDAQSLPTLINSNPDAGVPATAPSTPPRQPVFGCAPLERQHSVRSADAQSTAVPTLVRLLSPRRKSVGHRPVPLLRQPAIDSTKPRVMADSATILSFAELRRSIEAAADESDAASD